jgi:hypothetical protein
MLLYGQTCQNVLHFINPDGVLTPQQIASDVVTNWITPLKAQQPFQLSYFNILVQNIDTPTEAPYSLAVAIAGTRAGEDRMPSFACWVLKLLTGFRGRHGRGRVYIAGVYTDSVQLGICTPTFRTQFETNQITPIMNAYGPTGSGSPLSLAVRAQSGSGFELHPIASIQLRSTLGTQRRRNIGIGI